ncbi:30S ribosomal protein S15 protein [Thalictrum thalictroides]|uniref:30S ribosomal protein S15 n=1 Tax=Thalictrum thalictroides TaxID=46969 RepID=A0A7J6V136_THATH|nr:30S ribosomal protein S15 protein [Thalictrum thalictroides]
MLNQFIVLKKPMEPASSFLTSFHLPLPSTSSVIISPPSIVLMRGTKTSGFCHPIRVASPKVTTHSIKITPVHQLKDFSNFLSSKDFDPNERISTSRRLHGVKECRCHASSVIPQEENRGSAEFQVFSFTNKIRRLTSHLELHRKDYLSQRGLRKILGKRQRLLAYLSKKNGVRYKELISQLNIREPKTR